MDKLRGKLKSALRGDKNFKLWQKTIVIILLLGVAVSSAFLFYKQAEGIYYRHLDWHFELPHEVFYPDTPQTTYLSDLSGHIESALNTDIPAYTITKPLYRFVFWHLGGIKGIAILLAAFVVGAIWATKLLLDYYFQGKGKRKNGFRSWMWAIILNFNIAIHLPFITHNFNVGLQEPNEWHNSTYTIMKFFALLAMLLYFKIEKTYLKKIEAKKYILFTLLLLLVNAVKPSFIIALAPAMLVFFIIDFFKNIKNKRAILNIIIFGCSVLISLGVLYYQSKVLYGTGEGSDGSGIGFSPFTALSQYHPYPVISILQSAAFPLFILITNFKTIIRDRRHSVVLAMCVVSLALYLFAIETGPRASDGNFDWSYTFALMMAFISTVSILRARTHAALEATYTEAGAQKALPVAATKSLRKEKAYLAVAYTILAAHVVSGLYYYGILLTGASYN
ncbi:hypothetical protein IJJ18_02185 [Candidatus Saccharibacteria bacterium]|nr:hypothetical protein [Candidatus Saccharibacteria bacterium]